MSLTAPLPESPAETSAPAEREPETATLSFLQPSAADLFWQGVWVRAVLLALAILLTASLPLQVLVHERDRLAAQFPAWRPALVSLCEWFGCRVVALRQIESIVIESSALSKLTDGVYRLSFVLKSTALVDLALPALELTLTDAQDQVIVRRVVPPVELQTDGAVLAASSEHHGSLVVSVQTPEDARRLAGYRLLAFYP